jgi:hypothetical protein
MSWPAEALPRLHERHFRSLRASLTRHSRLLRLLLYAYVVLITCPIRYWPLQAGIDQSWRFALNYASSQGSAVASKIVFMMGPLFYLISPQNIGDNLAQGLLFQAGLWLVLATIFTDVFFWAGFPLRNLALFSFCLALATQLFWFNYVGTDDLMLTGALLLIVVFYLRGSLVRYLGALTLVGALPMFKLSAAMVGLSALAGFLVERAVDRRWKALTDAAYIVAVPAVVTTALCFCVMPSLQSVLYYLRGSVQVIGGYSSAASLPGPDIVFVSAFEALAVLAVFLGFQAASAPRLARFYVLLLALPVFFSFKHGFVRNDTHALLFFCFIALALALVSLTLKLDKTGASWVVPLALVFFMIWQDNVSFGSILGLHHPTGARAAWMLWGALRFDNLKHRLDDSITSFPERSRIEPELAKLIGDSSVASLSADFTNLAAARMRLELYPVVERCTAYTPYLDRLNAAWIREQGSKFLVFDGRAIDGRDPWAETPAMWLEIYRWYDARLLGPRNLLLERRAGPRFTRLETISRFRMESTGELRFPVSSDDVFWTVNCGYSTKGRLLKLLFRVPEVLMSVHQLDGSTRSARVIPEVLVSPVLGNYLPGDLSQFYAVFDPGGQRRYSVDHVLFNTSGNSAYSSSCDVEMLRVIQ